MTGFDHDVAIVGSGPAGIAAATALSRAGIRDIVVYEREGEIGGVPRHTQHPSFGLLVFKRPLTGPGFIRALVGRCPAVRFETNATITAIRAGGALDIATPAGLRTIRARHIILATGARETPRHARLVSGLRPQGVTTTGALQQFVYLQNMRPFRRPIIVGTELVSFSALWTLRHAGLKPVAMIEANNRITAYAPATLFARIMRVPILYNTKITDIGGIEALDHISVTRAGRGPEKLPCDGVIFSGCFVGENTVAGASHLQVNLTTRIPLVDQNWVTSDPDVSAIGNAIHPADMGDQCYLEGLKAGAHVAAILGQTRSAKPAPSEVLVNIRHGDAVKMTTPSFLRTKTTGETLFDLAFHTTCEFRGAVRVSHGNDVLYEKTRHYLPARRIALRRLRLKNAAGDAAQPIEVTLIEKG